MYALILNKSDSIGKHKELQFMWEDYNYIIKMRSDMNFLFGSDFSKILNFSEFPDPLLIVPSKPLEKKMSKTNDHQKFISIPTMLFKRVKLAEKYILDEDTDELQSKSESNKTILKPSKRTDEKAAKRILETIIEETCEKTLREVALAGHSSEKQRVNKKTAKNIRESIIDELVKKAANEVALKTYNDAIESHIKKHIDGIATKYIEDEVDKVVKQIIKEELKNAKVFSKESAKNEQKYKKEKELADKKRKEEELALEKKLAYEREENEKKRKAEEAFRKKTEEENNQIAKMILE